MFLFLIGWVQWDDWDAVFGQKFEGRIGSQLLRDAPCAKRLLAAAEDGGGGKLWDVTL